MNLPDILNNVLGLVTTDKNLDEVKRTGILEQIIAATESPDPTHVQTLIDTLVSVQNTQYQKLSEQLKIVIKDL